MNKSYFSVNSIVILIVISLSIFIYYGNKQDNHEEEYVLLESFNVDYTNKNDKSIDVRYKYITSYEVTNNEISENWRKDRPLLTLSKEGIVVAESYYNENRTAIIPEVSNSIKLQPNETISYPFEVKISNDVQQQKDLVRFDVHILIEELKEGRWTPVYQTVFMERGPYWSLDKGPIEKIE